MASFALILVVLTLHLDRLNEMDERCDELEEQVKALEEELADLRKAKNADASAVNSSLTTDSVAPEKYSSFAERTVQFA